MPRIEKLDNGEKDLTIHVIRKTTLTKHFNKTVSSYCTQFSQSVSVFTLLLYFIYLCIHHWWSGLSPFL